MTAKTVLWADDRARRRCLAFLSVPKHACTVALWVTWLTTRAILYPLATAPRLIGDVGLYQRWYTCCLSHGAFPVADPMWQYPPGAGLVVWLAGRLPGSYPDDFAFLAIGCDLAATLLLCAAPRRGGSLAGAWYWVCGAPLLGSMVIGRLDMIPVALSIVALRAPGRDGVRGAATGAAAAVKAWPVTLLAGTAPGQWRRTLAAAAAVLAATCVIFPGPAASFLAHQAARGVEIESVAATPLMIWRQAGWHGMLVYRYGAWQLSGAGDALARDASRAGLILVAAAVVAWCVLIARRARWRPEFAADAPLAATLLVLVAGPVLSPQYLLWVVGLAAACLATGRTTQRPVALAVLCIVVLTMVVFPVGWQSLLKGSGAITAVLVARNTLLVMTAAASCWRLLRAAAPPTRAAAPPTRAAAPPEHPEPSARHPGSGHGSPRPVQSHESQQAAVPDPTAGR